MSCFRRTLSRSGVLLLSASLFAASGCGSSDDVTASSGGAGGTGAQGGAPNAPTTLSFDEADTLTLIPGESHDLIVSATPAGDYTVKFSLLGDYKDASLDTSEAQTDSAGVAHVTVNAPSSATTFSVRAAVGDSVSSKLGVSVSASGFATLQVMPTYAGKRGVSYWTASVRTGTTCADLSGDLTTDGDIKGTAPDGQIPQIGSVPVGPALAVTLRGGFSIAGCQDVVDIAAGEVNAVKVKVTDLPMQLAETDLELSLGLDPLKTSLDVLLNKDAVLSALVSGGADDGQALLEAMQSATPDTATAAAFQLARKTNNWDTSLAAALGNPKAIRALVGPWLSQGLANLATTQCFQGSLRGAGKTPGHAYIELSSVGGVDATEANLAAPTLAAWTADPDDTVLLGTTLFFAPSRLATAVAVLPAKAAAPSASNVPSALAALLDCQTVGATLAGTGDAYPGCDASCAEALCEAGLEAMWNDARNASVGTAGTLVIAATGKAGVDDNARPAAFSGSWIGSFNSGSGTLAVSGPASGAKPPPPR